MSGRACGDRDSLSCLPPSWTEKHFFPLVSSNKLLVILNSCCFMGRKMSQKQKIRQTRGWLEQNADFREWIVRWWRRLRNRVGSPPPPHFFPARRENEEGDKGAGCCVLTPDFPNGRKSSGRRAVSRSRSWLRTLQTKKNNNKKKFKPFTSVQSTRVTGPARAAGD